LGLFLPHFSQICLGLFSFSKNQLFVLLILSMVFGSLFH
jgi:hypothetical protein